MGQKIRLNETQLKKIISESVKRALNEYNRSKFGYGWITFNDEEYDTPEFKEWLVLDKERSGWKGISQESAWNWFCDLPRNMKQNVYQSFLSEKASEDDVFYDGIRAGNEQLFRDEKTGEIYFHGPNTINGWFTKEGSKWAEPKEDEVPDAVRARRRPDKRD